MKAKHPLFFILILSLLEYSESNGQDSLNSQHYEIYYGSSPNIESGAVSILNGTSLLFDQTNSLISQGDHNKALGFTLRLGNVVVIQLYGGAFLYGWALHERFGHKARSNEFGIEMELISNFPALGGDDIFIVDHNVPAFERQTIVAGGPEATSFLAYKATQRLYSQEYVGSYIGDYLVVGKLIDGILYIEDEIKPFLEDPNQYYRDNANYFSRNPVPNDPLSYVMALTESYGYYDDFLDKNSIWVQEFPDMGLYTENEFIHDQYDRMKHAYSLTALDPVNLYFLYGNIIYLLKGKDFFKSFMFKINNVAFMPSIRANMGELGAENYFDLFMRINGLAPFNVYYRQGGNMFHQINGVGAEINRMKFTSRISSMFQIDYWKNERNGSNNFNVMTGVEWSNRQNLLSIIGKIGYKDHGILMGKPLRKGVYAYLGLGLNFKYDKNEP